MQVNRELNSNIWDHVSATKEAYEIYTTKENESAGIQITYSMIFVLFSIVENVSKYLRLPIYSTIYVMIIKKNRIGNVIINFYIFLILIKKLVKVKF